MQRSAPLCKYCSQIPLNPEEYNLEESKKYALSGISQIKNSLCPLCRLVLSHLEQDFIATPSQEKVELSWMRGPGRRQAFRSIDAEMDTWIGFSSQMKPHHEGNDSYYYFIQPWTGPLVDTARILRWISSCEQSHRSKCAMPTNLGFSEAFRGLHLLRLIDVELNCLVEKTVLEKYMALSYVWGAVSNFRLTKANRPALLEPGYAVILARRLGCRYLWVDALCLLQNDAEDLELGVNVMDIIYERAWVTVVAACGHDANAHLPGIQEGTRNGSYNVLEVAPGVEMGVVQGLDGLLKRSVYESRAWTFQEQVLSRRVLYFIDNKVFYRCRAAEHAEHFVDIFAQTRVGGSLGSLLPEAVLMSNPVFDLSTMLFYYTKRAITNQNDASRAMAGITRKIAEATKCNFFQGLPTAMLDLFIIFYAAGSILQRRSIFPSYSWTGWRSGIDIDVLPGSDIDDNTWLKDHTWIIWYKRSPSGITNLVWDTDANPSFPLSDMEYVGYRRRRLFSDGRHAHRQLNTKRTMPTEQVTFSRPVPTYPLLQFWTLSLFYRIFDINVFSGTAYLEDSKKARCGFVYLDGFEETTFFESQGPFEVILLSEARSQQMSHHDFKWRDPYPLAAGQWEFYNVLLLEWQGGIAERRGFGLLHQGAIEFSLASGPSWKEIFLA
ncbi:heterokaryon incompatibility protein-domain-containing protein [Fusarium avenaceum]|nr:heterokaryon incompatibility protein-domain-containing protein [Fusarium avenaceum]